MNPRTQHRYVLIADASRARLFHRGSEGTLDLVGTFEHEDARARARSPVSDAQGRKPAGPAVARNHRGRPVSPGVGRPGAAPRSDPKAVEADKFARELAATLEVKLRDPEHSVVLIAPARFLGMLRGHLTPWAARRIEVSVDKNLTKAEPPELRGRVRNALWPRRSPR